MRQKIETIINEMRETWGDTYVLDELLQALSTSELEDNFAYIAKNNDFDWGEKI